MEITQAYMDFVRDVVAKTDEQFYRKHCMWYRDNTEYSQFLRWCDTLCVKETPPADAAKLIQRAYSQHVCKRVQGLELAPMVRMDAVNVVSNKHYVAHIKKLGLGPWKYGDMFIANGRNPIEGFAVIDVRAHTDFSYDVVVIKNEGSKVYATLMYTRIDLHGLLSYLFEYWEPAKGHVLECTSEDTYAERMQRLKDEVGVTLKEVEKAFSTLRASKEFDTTCRELAEIFNERKNKGWRGFAAKCERFWEKYFWFLLL